MLNKPNADTQIAVESEARTWRKRVLDEWLVIALLLTSFTLFALHGAWFSRVEQTVYDQALSLWKRPAQGDIVIVGIDEDSLKQLGRWPWARAIHATLLGKLTQAQAKAVVLDIVLTEPDLRDPKQDQLLAESIRANAKVVLPLLQKNNEGAPVGEALPAPLLGLAAAGVGHISTRFDSDGVLRSVFLRAGFRAPRHPLLALAALEVAEPGRIESVEIMMSPSATSVAADRENLSPDAVWVLDRQYRIPFAGPPKHFKQISYIDVLRGDVALDEFRHKIVLVGMTAPSMGDEFPTPLSGDSGTATGSSFGQSHEARAMPGIEIHANTLQGLREGINLQEASFAATSAVSLILILGLFAGFLWLSPSQSIILTAGLCVAAVIGSALLFRLGQFWISPVVAVMAMVLAHPLWSWRKLHATQRYFDEELSRLKLERSVVAPDAGLAILPNSSPGLPILSKIRGAFFTQDVVEKRIASVRDATQLLRNLNRFVADSLESLPEAAMVTDFTGRVMLANSSADRLFGFKHESVTSEGLLTELVPIEQPLEGRDVFELMQRFKHDSNKSWRELWAEASAVSRIVSIEARMVQNTDNAHMASDHAEDMDFLVQIAPSMSRAGVHTGTILTLTDISPLRESERRRDEALRFLSHDMRSPQASIITLLEMQREDPESMPAASLFERIDRYAKRTLTLADDFLRLAKAERSKPQDFELVEFSGLMQDAADEAWSLASAKGISVKLQLPDDEAWVLGDRDLLTRVLMNLLSNAIKYSPPKSRITCSLHRETAAQNEANGEGDNAAGVTAGVAVAPGLWVIDVEDQGYGISEANMSKLFSRFVRLHEEGQPEEEGIGLGLVFVKTVVTRHDGSISVRSKVAEYAQPSSHNARIATSAIETPAVISTNHGTTFSVSLPAQSAPLD